MSAASFPAVFEAIASSRGASGEVVRGAFDAIFAGAWTPVQIAAFAVSLRLVGETPAMITAAIEAMRATMIGVDHGLPKVMDTCGTGGDGKGSLNLSTAAAIVVAAAGLPVAKHGNRSVSSRTGSADVLEALGVPLDVPPAAHPSILERAAITFLFAPAHHPAMRHSGAARRELAVRTIFNVLGPIANPARATHQLVGAFDDRVRPVLAETLCALGSARAWVVRGDDGLDEISPFGPTRVSELVNGEVIERAVRPEDFGFAIAPEGAIDGGDAGANAARIKAIFDGERDRATDAIALNAAAAIAIGREDTSPGGLRAAGDEARARIASGAAAEVLRRWIREAKSAIDASSRGASG